MFDIKKLADTYDQIGLYFSATRPKLSDEVIPLLPTLPLSASVLDLGCGNGVLLTALPRNVNYTGLDFSQTLINEAKKHFPDQTFILGDIIDPTIWQGLPQFDFIAALAVFHHLPTPEDHLKLLRNIKQHLNPTGNCLISVWNLNQLKFAKYRHADNSKAFSVPFHHGPKRDFYAFESDELPSLATQAGFTKFTPYQKGENLYLKLD